MTEEDKGKASSFVKDARTFRPTMIPLYLILGQAILT